MAINCSVIYSTRAARYPRCMSEMERREGVGRRLGGGSGKQREGRQQSNTGRDSSELDIRKDGLGGCGEVNERASWSPTSPSRRNILTPRRDKLQDSAPRREKLPQAREVGKKKTRNTVLQLLGALASLSFTPRDIEKNKTCRNRFSYTT